MQDKASIRRKVFGIRDTLPHEARATMSRAIARRVIGVPAYRSAGTVLLFASFRSEVDTALIIRDALAAGKMTVFPAVDRAGKRLRLFRITDEGALAPGYMGIPEPTVREDEVGIGEVDFVLVPGAAFDIQCARIGYGGGFYDRLLAGAEGRPFRLAPAFDAQVVDRVPAVGHDIRMHLIMTEMRTITCDGLTLYE